MNKHPPGTFEDAFMTPDGVNNHCLEEALTDEKTQIFEKQEKFKFVALIVVVVDLSSCDVVDLWLLLY